MTRRGGDDPLHEFERLDLQVTTKKGGVLIGCFSVARGDDFCLSVTERRLSSYP